MSAMRNWALCLVIALFTEAMQGQNSYYCNGELVELEPVEGKVLVELRTVADPSRHAQVFEEVKALPGVIRLVASNGRRAKFETGDVSTTLQRTGIIPEVEFVASYLRTTSGDEMAPTNLIVVKLRSLFDMRRMLDDAAAHGLSLLKSDKYDDRLFVLKSAARNTAGMLQVAKILFETGLYDFAEPNFVRQIRLYSNDPLFGDQWSLNNTGQGGGEPDADTDAVEAWSITRGHPSIRVAVVDEGVELTHPDLVDNLLPGYDASGNDTEGGPINGATHGTNVAGIIGAVADNGIGIAGVAPKCSIVPVSTGIAAVGWTDLEGADAINWAWDNGGADVINMSWGMGGVLVRSRRCDCERCDTRPGWFRRCGGCRGRKHKHNTSRLSIRHGGSDWGWRK